jgi:thiamine-phosphate pyrophosphorylase
MRFRRYKDDMTPQLFLIAPEDAEPAGLIDALRLAQDKSPVPALLLPRGQRDERRYKELVKAVLPQAQAAGTAVLIEGEPGLVRTLGADGLHVSGDAGAVREAVAALKPQLIVGAGGIGSRDAAMTAGELGVDYILFGPLSGSISAAQRDLAQWWAETMEVPGVLSDPAADPGNYDAAGCEFIGLALTVREPAP